MGPLPMPQVPAKPKASSAVLGIVLGSVASLAGLLPLGTWDIRVVYVGVVFLLTLWFIRSYRMEEARRKAERDAKDSELDSKHQELRDDNRAVREDNAAMRTLVASLATTIEERQEAMKAGLTDKLEESQAKIEKLVRAAKHYTLEVQSARVGISADTVKLQLSSLDAKVEEVLDIVKQILPEAQDAVRAHGVPVGRHIVQVVQEAVSVAGKGAMRVGPQMLGQGTVTEPTPTHIYADRQRRMVAAFTEAIPVLRKLAANQPVTEEDESRAVQGLESITLAESAEVEDKRVDHGSGS